MEFWNWNYYGIETFKSTHRLMSEKLIMIYFTYLVYSENFGRKNPGTIKKTKIVATVTPTIIQASLRYGRINNPKSMSKGVGRAIINVLSNKIGIMSNMSCRSNLNEK